jgi:hypothetical protein
MFQFFQLPQVPLSNAPSQVWHTGVQVASMVAEAQMVIAYRILGQFGLWAVKPDENQLMISEKQVAFIRSSSAALKAVQAGKRPDQILSAAVTPLRRKTRPNMRRLSRCGPGSAK